MRLFKRRDSESWWVDFRDPDGNRRRRPAGRSKREAEAVLERIRASILAGTYFNDDGAVEEHAAQQVTLGRLWEESRAGRTGVSRSTWKDDQVRVERILLPFFGKNTALGALTPASFAKFVKWRLEKGLRKKSGVTKSTVARDLSVVRSMWGWGRRFLPAGVPPCPVPENSELKLPYQSPARTEFFSREELDLLLAEAGRCSPDRLYPAVALGAFAGLRRGEIVTLRWADVDLESGLLRVRNYTRDGEEHRTKNEEDRTIPIRPRLAEILREVEDTHLAPEHLADEMRRVESWHGQAGKEEGQGAEEGARGEGRRHRCRKRRGHALHGEGPNADGDSRPPRHPREAAPRAGASRAHRIRTSARNRAARPRRNVAPPWHHPDRAIKEAGSAVWQLPASNSLTPRPAPPPPLRGGTGGVSRCTGAGDGSWTHDNCVGNAVLYR